MKINITEGMNIYRQLSTLKNISSIYLFIIILPIIAACSQQKHNQVEKKLVTQNCQGCHLLPNPQHLPKNTWEFDVLPLMAARLGQQSGKLSEISTLKEMLLFPDTSAISFEEWQRLKNFIISSSPAQSIQSKTILEIHPELEGFEVIKPTLKEPPFISLTHFDKQNQQFFYGNSINKTFNQYNLEKGIVESIKLDGAPSYVTSTENGMYVLTMGGVMPHNKKIGTLTFMTKSGDEPKILIDDLQRPVHASLGDLDGDEKEDMIIAAFGNYRGELAWYSNIASSERKKNVLRAMPGAIKTIISDFNKDGLPDILALMAQGDEGFFIYLNEGEGKFREKILMRFPPTYGSTYFEWKDFDGDGLEDILYVNGDNGDYTPIVKNFHGIRLFRNKGNMSFEEVFFLEHHGAFKAISEDFDLDGDLDIAAISYFPDYKNRPQESFIYYENKGDYVFQACTFEGQPSGKWLTMEAGDIDGDGDKDIVLGSAMFLTSEAPKKLANDWRRNLVPILILKNKRNSVL